MVAILCAAPNSVYHQIPGVDVYDRKRDARTFAGGMPVVAHPPCRAWSAYCRHQAKPEPGEKELALWCCDQLREWGGVLEQPAHSHLFAAAGLPVPPERRSDLFSIEVWQSWWGYTTRKRTWLAISKVDPRCVELPYALTPPGDRQRWNKLSKHKRAATCRAFAEWLIGLALLAPAPPENPE